MLGLGPKRKIIPEPTRVSNPENLILCLALDGSADIVGDEAGDHKGQPKHKLPRGGDQQEQAVHQSEKRRESLQAG